MIAIQVHALSRYSPKRFGERQPTNRALLGRKGVFGMDSLQLPALGFGLLQDGNVRIGVFPEGEKDLVSGEENLLELGGSLCALPRRQKGLSTDVGGIKAG